MKEIRIGVVGVGGIARGAHIAPAQEIEGVRITAICDIDEAKLLEMGEKLNIPADHRFLDYHDLIALEDVDAVEVCTSNDVHVPIALAAVKAGKHVNIEKPLGLSADQARELAAYPRAEAQVAMMCFSYRFMPAVRYAKHLIEEGLLGDITGVQVAYLKESAMWEGRGMEWRFEKHRAGTGVLGDLGVHLIDMTQLLAGKITSVCGKTRIVVEERPYPDGTMGKVETDDVCSFLATLDCGAEAVFTVTRAAWGHKNTIRFEIYGTKGALSFDLNDPTKLKAAGTYFPEGEQELHEIIVPAGYTVRQEQTFIDAIRGKQGMWFPSLEDGYQSQKILDALLQSSVENRWVEVG